MRSYRPKEVRANPSKKWKVSDLTNAKGLGEIEFQDIYGEYHHFYIFQTKNYPVVNRLVFGTATNTGFLESGYMEIEDYFSIDENLQELLNELETYYNDGPYSVARIVTNDRMGYVKSNPRKNMERVVSLEKFDEETGRGFTIFRCYRNFQTWYEVEYFHKNSKKEMLKEFSQYEDAENFAENFLNRK